MIILHLNLKKKWFDMIVSGEKKEEYREIKPYWIHRLTWHEFHNCDLFELVKYQIDQDVFRHDFDIIRFTNGYGKKAPSFDIELKEIMVGSPISGMCEQGRAGNSVFILKLGNIINI